MPGNSNCWTGSEKGSYHKATAGRGIAAQRLNPEVTFNEHQTPNYVPLVNYSVQMKRMAIEMAGADVMKIRPESDSYQGIETRQQKEGIHDGSGDPDDDSSDSGSGDFNGSGNSERINMHTHTHTICMYIELEMEKNPASCCCSLTAAQ